MHKSFFLLFITLVSFSSLYGVDPEFVIFTGSYNNARWVERHLSSIASQTYQNWECLYINDASSDGTRDIAERFVLQNGMASKIKIVNHSQRHGLVANMDRYIRQVDPKKIIIIVDGDDFLADKNALSIVAAAYRDSSVWMTYGNYKAYPYDPQHNSMCRKIPSEVMKNNSFRKVRFVTSHLRTFYAKLFHNIQKSDLQELGAFFQIAGDVVTMFPMLEMSSKNHIRFIDQVLLRYNTENPASDFLRRKEQMRVEALIRKRKPYKPLKTLF